MVIDMMRRGNKTDAVQLPTEAELEILNILWARGPSTVRDVRGQQQGHRLHHCAEADAGDGRKRPAGTQRAIPVARVFSARGQGANAATPGAQSGPTRVRRLRGTPGAGRAVVAEGIGGGAERDSADAGRV